MTHVLNHSVVPFVPLLQALAGIYWNHKQCIHAADCCEILATRERCKANLYGGVVVSHLKEAIKINRADICLCREMHRETSMLLPQLIIKHNTPRVAVFFKFISPHLSINKYFDI